VVRVINDQVAIVENVDVFTPIHDDPHTQGEIVACNASNDVFAMGATELISLQAFLGYPMEMNEDIAVGVLKGMNDFMVRHNSCVSGGQTITNPIPVFGGICLGVAKLDEIVYSHGAKPGNKVVLTKPLGIQSAMRSYRDLQDERRDELLERFSEPELLTIQETAVRIMTFSNLEVAEAMKQVGVLAATDVTGFGLLGHARNVATRSSVDVVIDRIPVINGILDLADFFGHKLRQGLAAETAGGMLVFLSPETVEEFCGILRDKGLPCWTIGETAKPRGTPEARLAEDVQLIETGFP
jgi:selenide,water dikinase